MFTTLLVILLSMASVSAQNLQCDMANLMGACIMQNQQIQVIMSEVESNPQAATDKVCNNQPIVVVALDCATNFGIKCLPKEAINNLTDFIPTQENWKNGLEFVCKHKEEPVGDCLKKISADFYTCKMKDFQNFMASKNITSLPEKKDICRFLDIKPCLQSLKGSCPDRTLSIISQAIEKFIPMDTCKDSANAASFLSFSKVGCYGLGLIVLGMFFPLV